MNLLYIYSLALHPWVLLSSSGLRAPGKWLGGHRFVSCRELRFFFFSLSHVRDVFIISFSHLFDRVKIYHLSFFRYLYYSKPFLAYYASFHVLTCIIHSLNEHKNLNITPLSRFSFFDDIFLSAVKQLKSLVKVFLEKMLRTKERLLGNLRPLRRSHQRYCNRTQLSISPFFPEFHLRSQHCSLETRENELRERIPVPHESYLKSISSSRPCS